MEIKAELKQPYTEDERIEFIVKQNHNLGYEIREYKHEVSYEVEIQDYDTIKETIDVEIPYTEIEQQEVPVYVIDEETGEEVQDGTQTIEVPVDKVKIEQQEIEKEVVVGSHIETKVKEVVDLQAWGYTEEEKQEQERERINLLSLTKREVFLAIYKDKGITPEQIRGMIKSETGLIEFDYSERFYRGNPLIEQLGLALGYTSEMLDYLFVNKIFPDVNNQIDGTVENTDIQDDIDIIDVNNGKVESLKNADTEDNSQDVTD